MKTTITLLFFVILSKITLAQINTTSFAPKVDYLSGVGTSSPVGIISADLDNDGNNDIVVGNQGVASISVFRNTSTLNSISLSTKVDYTASNTVSFIRIKDLDGDGKVDVILCSASGNGISVFKNTTSTTGNITFATRQDFTCASGFYNIDVEDVDGDLKPDIVVTNSGAGSFSVFRNTSTSGTISFATRIDQSCNSDPSSVVIFDIDGDGKKDLAITRYSPSQLVIFRNTTTTAGSPTFVSVTTAWLGSYPHFIKCADLDGDGKKDLVTGNFVSNNISIIKNTTSTVNAISFQTPYNLSSGSGNSYCQGISLADFDNDNKIDIGVCNNGNNNISIFKNNSVVGTINSTSFATQVNFSVSSGPIDLFASDLNNDGKLEVLVSNNASSNISILRNRIIANEPTNIASNLVFSNTTPTSATLTFTKGNGSRRIVVAKATNAVNSAPLDSFSYLAKDTFGLGTQIGTGNYVVYSDTGNTVNVKGLNPGNNYYFAVYEYNGTAGFSNYLTSSSLTGNTLIGYAYFSKSSGNLNSLATWGPNTDGSGTSPASFGISGTSYYVVNNGSPSITGNWFITGTNTTVVFGDGTNSGNFVIPTGVSFGTDSFYVNNNFTFTIQGNIYTNKAGFHASSIAQYVLSTPQNIVTANYGNLIISGSTKTITGNVMVKSVLAMFNNINCNGYTLTLGESATQTGTLNRSSGIIIGNFKRWFAANTNTGASGLMPIGTASVYRPIQVNFTSAPSSGGTITSNFITGTGGNSGFPIFDFTTSPIVLLNKTGFEGYWKLTPSDGLTGGTYTCNATATGFSGISSVSDLRLVRRNISATSWSLAGTSVLGSGTVAIPIVSTTGITSIGGEFAVASDSSINPLPVQLISFKGNWKGNDVILNWKTASEENNSHFEIEKLKENEWKNIGKVKGNGHSTMVNNYTFVDVNLQENNEQNKTNYYRMKQVDFNGDFVYSEIITLEPQSIKNSISISPVPMQNVLNITTASSEVVETVSVYDINGKFVLQANNETSIDVSKLLNGIYTIKVITDKQVLTSKITK
ncbi:MAG: FG-GAP-like repeat-containing protein [Bacteroidia bacterium]